MRRVGFSIIISLLLVSVLVCVIGLPAGGDRLLPPSAEHLFGTDMLGRDVAFRTAVGTLVSAVIAASVVILSLLSGIILAYCYMHPLFPKGLLLGIADGLKSIPSIVLALFLSAITGPGIPVVVFSLSLSHISDISRTAYSEYLRIAEEGYTEAAIQMKAKRSWIFLHHMLPNMKQYLYEQGVSIFMTAIIAESSLSFLGCGVPQPVPSLGSILSEARPVMMEAWWMILFPSVVLFLMAISLQMLISETDSSAH